MHFVRIKNKTTGKGANGRQAVEESDSEWQVTGLPLGALAAGAAAPPRLVLLPGLEEPGRVRQCTSASLILVSLNLSHAVEGIPGLETEAHIRICSHTFHLCDFGQRN